LKLTALELAGAYLIELEPRRDERGYFARQWCETEFAAAGLSTSIAQINTQFSPDMGTLRGMHLQTGAECEVKVVRCLRGAAYDVLIDLRRDSPTCRRWVARELTPDNGRMLYVPEGFAHGYQTLQANTEVLYLTSKKYAPAAATGVRYNDPSFAIAWPLPVTRISDQDCNWPDFGPGSLAFGG
jgi:dTDP-4-dehydrorhamnose 3,5-epimerase